MTNASTPSTAIQETIALDIFWGQQYRRIRVDPGCTGTQAAVAALAVHRLPLPPAGRTRRVWLSDDQLGHSLVPGDRPLGRGYAGACLYLHVRDGGVAA